MGEGGLVVEAAVRGSMTKSGDRSLAGLFGWRGSDEDRDGEQLRRLLEINRALVAEQQPSRLYSRILDAGVELTGAERAFLVLTKDAGGESASLSVEASRNVDREEIRSPLAKISQTVAQRVVDSGESVVTDSAQDDDEIGPSTSIAELKLRSILAVPLKLRDAVIGCLYFDNRFQRGTFQDEHRKLLELFADQASLAVHNARLHAENAAARAELQRLNQRLEERLHDQEAELESIRTALEFRQENVRLKHDYPELVGRSPAMIELLRLLDVVVETEYPVLITGESGTGKEMVARAIHTYGRRCDGPFVAENCAAISESLLEAELFGHVKGAFTGADREKTGLFEEADRGTLFLDEIGDMDLAMQRKLLRVLQEGEFRKVGGREPIRVDVRIVSATNADLVRKLEEGSFREDLYYRLKGMAVRVPPLRERRADIHALIEYFLEDAEKNTGRKSPEISPEAVAQLTAYSWPGNVRELRNEVLRLAVMATDRIEAAMIQGLGDGVPQPHLPLAGQTLAQLEKEAIRQALEAARGKRVEAARMLGLPRRTFYNRLKRYDLG